MRGYALDKTWDDPFEHLDERRRASRYNYRFRLSIAAENALDMRRVVGPGIVRNISLSGVLLVTKHTLSPEQRVLLEVPTGTCADTLCLPNVFEGTAQVIRSSELDGGKRDVATVSYTHLDVYKRQSRGSSTSNGVYPPSCSATFFPSIQTVACQSTAPNTRNARGESAVCGGTISRSYHATPWYSGAWIPDIGLCHGYGTLMVCT